MGIGSGFVKMIFTVLCGMLFTKGTAGAVVGGGHAMKLTSTAFNEGGMIPEKYTCDGADISPALAWSDVPDGVNTFALVCDDPDAPVGDWVHWVIYNIPGEVRSLPEKLPAEDSLADGACQGINDFRKTGYGGPCPPGGVHRYYFRLYALDVALPCEDKMTKKKLLELMKGHVLNDAVIMGRYKR